MSGTCKTIQGMHYRDSTLDLPIRFTSSKSTALIPARSTQNPSIFPQEGKPEPLARQEIGTGASSKDRPKVPIERSEFFTRCYLASYQYLTTPVDLMELPKKHFLGGAHYVLDPGWSYAFHQAGISGRNAGESDLTKFWRDVRARNCSDDNEKLSINEDDAWKSVQEAPFEVVPGETVASLLNRRAERLLEDNRARERSWVSNQERLSFPDRSPNYAYRQYLTADEYRSCTDSSWPNPNGGAYPLDLSEIKGMHQLKWGDKVVGEGQCFTHHSSKGHSYLIIPDIKTATETMSSQQDTTGLIDRTDNDGSE